MKESKVSVVLPVRNGQPYLQGAIRSILAQTHQNFELICIDDASQDSSARLLDSIQERRWVLIRHKSSLGLAASLNEGLQAAKGKYIARMDADDVSHPQRLALQVRFMQEHPAVDVVGSWARTIGAWPRQTWKYPGEDNEIRTEMIFNSALVHSSVMLRKSSFFTRQAWYDERIEQAQDYELWTRPAAGFRLANLRRVLLYYRVHSGQVGQNFGEGQQKTASLVRQRQLRSLGLRPTRAQLQLHDAVSRWQFGRGQRYLQQLEQWLLMIEQANRRTKIFEERALCLSLQRRWRAACRSALVGRKAAWQVYTRSPISAWTGHDWQDVAVFGLKAGWLWR